MNFRIAWKTPEWRRVNQWVRGLSRYKTKEAAERQVTIFQRVFPSNLYLIEPVPPTSFTVTP